MIIDYGCKLSNYDARDFRVKSSAVRYSALPDKYEITPPAVKNQGGVCSCVAHAVSSILESYTHPKTDLSTNFIYGIQKKLFNNEGKGMYLREACKIVQDYGDMLLEDCPGNTEVPKCHSIAEEVMNDQDKVSRAYQFHIESYYSCHSYEDIKYALVNHGPVLLAVKWWSDFKVNNHGVLYRSTPNSPDYGYHAIMVYGYNGQGLLCQNSWGKTWGKSGRFIYPYNFKFSEARGIVDWKNTDDLVIPKRNWLLDIIYKIMNFFGNMFRGK